MGPPARRGRVSGADRYERSGNAARDRGVQEEGCKDAAEESPVNRVATLVLLLASVGVARADCTDVVRKPQKPRDVARLDWSAAGRKWQVALVWQTMSVGDNGEEEAEVVLAVRDNLKRPTIGALEHFD